MPDAVESMTYNRQRGLPWHGLGTPADGLQTAAEAIVNGDLAWEVELRKLFTLNGKGNKIVVPGGFAVVRISDDHILGNVKTRYKPFQNREAFEFADNLVDSGEAKYDTAGSLRGGKVIFLSMEIPQHIMIGGEDEHQMFILLRTSHDGSTAIGVYIVIIRVVCMNTLTLAVNTAKYQWSMPHVGDLKGKLQEARETLGMSFQYADEFSKHVEQLMSIKVNDDKAVDILEAVLPVRPKTEEKIDAIMECLRTSDTNGYHGTGWGLLNALTEYQQHWRTGIQPEAGFHNTIDGELRRWRNDASQMILATA